MVKAALQFLALFVPPSRRDDEIARRKSVLLASILLLMVGSMPINVVVQIITGRWVLLFFSLSSLVTFGSLLIFSMSRDIHRIACQVMLIWGFIGVFGTAFLSGGLYSSVTPISILLPLLSLSLQQRRQALLWTIVTGTALVGLALLEAGGIVPEGQRELFEHPFPHTLNLLLMLGSASVFVWFLQSVNEVQRKQLIRERQHADDANEAKSAFLANMSHEIRTPMNGVLGLTEIVLLDTQLPAQHRRRLQTVLQSGRTLVELLNDILDLSKVEAGQLVLESIPWNPRHIVDDVQRLFGEVAHRKGLSLRIEVDEDSLPEWVLGDPTRVRQVLCNLVGNAVKFTLDGEVVLQLSMREMSLHFSVVDTGPGIAPALQERIFESFTQADASTVRQHGGTGLGLAICHRMTLMMGGQIALKSQLEDGSTFSITLPCTPCSPPAGTAPTPVPHPDLPTQATEPDTDSPHAAEPEADRGPLTDAQILVVEAAGIPQMLTQLNLKQLGCTVTLAEDGEKALAEILRNPQYDAVLIDPDISIMNGFEVTRLVRLAGRHLPIIGLTTSAHDTDQAHARAAGMNALIEKPFTRAQLMAVLQEAIEPSPVTPPNPPEAAPRPEPH